MYITALDGWWGRGWWWTERKGIVMIGWRFNSSAASISCITPSWNPEHCKLISVHWSVLSQCRYLCTAFYPHGTLREVLRAYPKKFRENLAHNTLLQISKGILYLHDNNLSHQDLSTQNIHVGGKIEVSSLPFPCSLLKWGALFSEISCKFYENV